MANLYIDIVSAHELADLELRDHLLMQGGASCCLPWLEVDDLVLYQRQGRNEVRKARLLSRVVRLVTLLKHLYLEGDSDEHWKNMEGDLYVGHLELGRQWKVIVFHMYFVNRRVHIFKTKNLYGNDT